MPPLDDFIKELVKFLGPNMSAVLGALVVVPYMIKVWESWGDSRSGIRAAAKERARLELLKLWLEVEALKKEHHLEPPFPLQPPLAATTPPSSADRTDAILGQAASVAGKSIRQPRVWRWISALDRRHRLLSTLALSLLGAIALPTGVVGIFAVILAFQIIKQPIDSVFAVILTVIELLLLLFLRALYRQYKLLRIARHQPQTAST